MQDITVQRQINGQNVFEQVNNMKVCENIFKISTGRRDDYTTRRLLNYPYFIENYKMQKI